MGVLSLPALGATLLPFAGAIPGSIITRKNTKVSIYISVAMLNLSFDHETSILLFYIHLFFTWGFKSVTRTFKGQLYVIILWLTYGICLSFILHQYHTRYKVQLNNQAIQEQERKTFIRSGAWQKELQLRYNW